MEQTKQKHIRILYNPKAGNGEGKQTAEAVWLYSKEPNTDCYDLTDPRVCEQFIKEVTADDTVILCGGDGTLMQFVNSVEPLLRTVGFCIMRLAAATILPAMSTRRKASRSTCSRTFRICPL